MTKPWISDAKSRRSKKAQRLLAQLRAELAADKLPEPDKRARKGRLTLHFDQLNQYRNLLVNSIRQQKRGIKVDPEGNGANDKTATVRGDRIRQIGALRRHAAEIADQRVRRHLREQRRHDALVVQRLGGQRLARKAIGDAEQQRSEIEAMFR